jgi:hypothetical protein
MKRIRQVLLALAALFAMACFYLAVWTGDFRWTGTGIITLVPALFVGAVTMDDWL